MRRPLHLALFALLGLLLLPVLAAGAFVLFVDPAAFVPRLAAAMEAATGRALTVAGPVRARWSLRPTLVLEGVSLANALTGSRPAMLTLRRVEVRVALLPLLARRIELVEVALDAPDLLLERDAAGRPNWAFAPPGQPVATTPDPVAGSAAVVREAGRRQGIAVGRVAVRDGLVTWRDGDRRYALALDRLLAEPTADGGLSLSGLQRVDGFAFALDGALGPTAALADPAAPWPARVALTAPGLRLSAEGGRREGSWAVRASFEAESPQRLAALVERPLPPWAAALGPVGLSGTVGTLGVADLRLTFGTADLSALRPGLRLGEATLTAADLDAPLTVAAAGEGGGLPLRLAGSLGPLRSLLAKGAAPWPVQLDAAVGEAKLRLVGSIADPEGLHGVNLRMEAEAPGLAPLGPLLGAAPPPITNVRGTATLELPGPDVAGGVRLTNLALASSAGDVAGTLAWRPGARPLLHGELRSTRLVLDGLRPAPPPPGPTAAPAPPPPPRAGRRIPALPLPGPLPLDLALRLEVGELIAGGLSVRDLRTTVTARESGTALDPFAATLPGGRLEGRLALAPDSVALRLRGEGVEAAPLLTALGAVPPPLAGRLDIDADLTGTGRDLRAVAATLTGPFGLALPGGRLDAAVLGALPPELRRALAPAGAQGGIALRCGALRLDAQAGQARLTTLLLEGPAGRLGGEGGIDLREETLALRLLPDLRLGPIALRAPVTVAGSFATPRVGVSPESALSAGIGAFLSLQRTPDRGLTGLADALGGADPVGCEAALRSARGGREGAMPPASAPSPPAAPEARPRAPAAPVQELLRGLLGGR